MTGTSPRASQAADRPDAGSGESEGISIVEVVDLDPKIGSQQKQKPTLSQTAAKTLGPTNNADLDSLMHSFHLPQVHEAATWKKGRKPAITEDQAGRTQRNLQVFLNNQNKRQEYIRERYKSQLNKYQGLSPLRSKEGRPGITKADPSRKSPDPGHRIELQIPLNLDRLSLKYQFTSSNRDNHLTNYKQRRQHHKIEMISSGNAAAAGTDRENLDATELIHILQNVHIRPQPLTNRLG